MIKEQLLESRLCSAFTLAEVLVTLGIIGVVASLTMPGLMGNYQKKANITAMKKAYSVLNQAYMNIVREQGIDAVSMCPTNDSKCLGDMFKSELKLISGELWIPNGGGVANCWEDKTITNAGEQHYCTVSADGIVYDFDMEWQRTAGRINAYIMIDTNGPKRPNKFGKDRYAFTINDTNINVYKSYKLDEDIIPSCKDGEGGMYDNLGCAYKYLYNDN